MNKTNIGFHRRREYGQMRYDEEESISAGKDCAYVDAITWMPLTASEPLPELFDSAIAEHVAVILADTAECYLVRIVVAWTLDAWRFGEK